LTNSININGKTPLLKKGWLCETLFLHALKDNEFGTLTVDEKKMTLSSGVSRKYNNVKKLSFSRPNNQNIEFSMQEPMDIQLDHIGITSPYKNPLKFINGSNIRIRIDVLPKLKQDKTIQIQYTMRLP
jgi:hypothetical protein